MAGNTRTENAVVNTYVNGQQAEQTLSKLTKSADGYKKAMQQAEKSGDIKSYKKAERDLKATNKQIRQLKKGQLEVNDLVKNLDDASYDELYKSTKKLEGQLKKLKKSHPDYEKKKAEVARYNSALRQQRLNMKGVTSGGGKMSGMFNSMKNQLSGLLPMLGLGTIIMGIQRLGRMQDELVKTRRDITRLTGATGAELDQITVTVRSLSKTFNDDYKAILEASNAVSQQFNISQTEALKKIEQGYLSGANASGEFLNQLKEYPTQFAEAEMSANDLFSVITQSVKSGVYSDKGADAVKEATIRIREMTPATQEAMDNIGMSSDEIMKGLRDGTMSIMDVIRQVSGRLDELPESSQEVGTAIADIFGGPGEDAGLRFLTTLKDIGGEYENVIDKSDPYYKQQKLLLDSTKELETAFNDAFGSANSWFGIIKTQINFFIADMFRAFKTVRQIKKEVSDTQMQETLEQDKKEIKETGEAFIRTMDIMIEADKRRLETGVKNIDQLRLEKDTLGEVRSAAQYLSEEERKEIEQNLERNKKRFQSAKNYYEMVQLQSGKNNQVIDKENEHLRSQIGVLDDLKTQMDRAVSAAEDTLTSKTEDELLGQGQVDLKVNDQEIDKVATNAQYQEELWRKTYQGRKQALDEQLRNMEISEQEHADKMAAIDNQMLQAKLDGYQQVFGMLSGLFAENTLAYKITASGQALIDSYKSANAAYSALAGIPVVGPALGAAAYAAALAQGLASVAKINNVQFAEGKYPMTGPDDGKTYNATYTPKVKTGIYSQPTVGLFNEDPRNPEMVVDGVKTKKLRYEFPDHYRWLLAGMPTAPPRQYAAGKYPESPDSAQRESQDNEEMMKELMQIQKMQYAATQESIQASKAAKDSFDRGINLSLYGKKGLYNATSKDNEIKQNSEL